MGLAGELCGESSPPGTATGTEAHVAACEMLSLPLPLWEVVRATYLLISQERKLKAIETEF